MDQLTDRRLTMAATLHSRPILQEGRNCWRMAPAKRAAVLVDGENYFARLDQVFRRAEKSIVILGWDFDASIRLRPDRPESPALGDLLRSLVEERPKLEVRVLVWSESFLHAPGAPLPLLLGAPWEDHPRIHVRLDRMHPVYAAHHQKIVCVDDAVAFAGGMDLTVRRWDTCEHLSSHPLRVGPDGAPHPPVHDVQMAVEGEAARLVAEVARQRWQRALGETIPSVAGETNLWPEEWQPDFTDVPVAAARTAPLWNGFPGYQEGAALTFDALAAAQRSIYVEAQYLTAPRVGDLLSRRLHQPQGPEIVIIIRRRFSSKMEGFVMGGNQDRLVQRLRQADRYGRLGVFYPMVKGDGEDFPITIHSKVIVVDDDLVRVGSSNLNNRSIGLDTEFDLAIEASDDAARRAIAALRHQLLAEHLGATAQKVREAVAAEGSLLGGIARLNGGVRRRLRPVANLSGLPSRPVFGTWLLDPCQPFEPLWFLRRKRPARPSPRRPRSSRRQTHRGSKVR